MPRCKQRAQHCAVCNLIRRIPCILLPHKRAELVVVCDEVAGVGVGGFVDEADLGGGGTEGGEDSADQVSVVGFAVGDEGHRVDVVDEEAVNVEEEDGDLVGRG